MDILRFSLNGDAPDVDLKAARRTASRLDPGVILAYTPVPVRVEVDVLRFRGGYVTCVRRDWKPGDTAYCRLCDLCDAFNNVCTKLVSRAVGLEDAATLDTRGLPVEGPAPPR